MKEAGGLGGGWTGCGGPETRVVGRWHPIKGRRPGHALPNQNLSSPTLHRHTLPQPSQDINVTYAAIRAAAVRDNAVWRAGNIDRGYA